MSTRERYGNVVWDAIVRNSSSSGGPSGRLMTVGQVARWSGVSTPTAKKYLTLLVEIGAILSFPVGKRQVYQFNADRGD